MFLPSSRVLFSTVSCMHMWRDAAYLLVMYQPNRTRWEVSERNIGRERKKVGESKSTRRVVHQHSTTPPAHSLSLWAHQLGWLKIISSRLLSSWEKSSVGLSSDSHGWYLNFEIALTLSCVEAMVYESVHLAFAVAWGFRWFMRVVKALAARLSMAQPHTWVGIFEFNAPY